MTVEVDGRPLYQWPVSTGKAGYDTPNGKFKAFRMERDHFSKEWDDAPMPFSIFFTQKGHAIHGSLDVKRLGTPGLAWLRAAAAGECREAVRAGRAGRRAQHHRGADRRRAVPRAGGRARAPRPTSSRRLRAAAIRSAAVRSAALRLAASQLRQPVLCAAAIRAAATTRSRSTRQPQYGQPIRAAAAAPGYVYRDPYGEPYQCSRAAACFRSSSIAHLADVV